MKNSFLSMFHEHLKDSESIDIRILELLNELDYEFLNTIEKAITTNKKIGEKLLFKTLMDYFETYHHSEILMKQRYGYYRESIKDHPELEHHLAKRMNLIQDYFHTITDAISGLMNLAKLYFPERIQQVDFIKLMVKYGIDFIDLPDRMEPVKGLEIYFTDIDQGNKILKELIYLDREYKAKDCFILISALHNLRLLCIKPTDNKKELIQAFKKTTGAKFHYRSVYNFKEDDYQFEINQKAREIKLIIS